LCQRNIAIIDLDSRNFVVGFAEKNHEQHGDNGNHHRAESPHPGPVESQSVYRFLISEHLFHHHTAIAAILSPILVGSITDRFFSAQKVLAVLMFAGALLMYFAAQQTTFAGFFPLLLAYSLTYMPTIALTNSIAFANVPDVERDFPRIRVMGTIGWIASGLACGFLPQMLGYADISPTNIPLLITAGSSALLGVFAFFLPDTPPKSTGKMDIKVMLGL
jgi:nucleoside transporter